jgi:hypothetical protein
VVAFISDAATPVGAEVNSDVFEFLTRRTIFLIVFNIRDFPVPGKPSANMNIEGGVGEPDCVAT